MHRSETAHPAEGAPQDPPRADEFEPLHDVEDFLDHGPRESSLTARVGFMTFALALCVVLAVVAAFLVSDKSALRRSDADMFGPLADQSALAIASHIGPSGAPDVDATASVRAELGRLAGVRRRPAGRALPAGPGGALVAPARTDDEGAPLELGPLPRVGGPSRRLGRDRLVVARSFSISTDAGTTRSWSSSPATRASSAACATSSRSPAARSARRALLVFLVPIAARILLAPLLRMADAARTGDVPSLDSVVGGGEEVVTLASRMCGTPTSSTSSRTPSRS